MLLKTKEQKNRQGSGIIFTTDKFHNLAIQVWLANPVIAAVICMSSIIMQQSNVLNTDSLNRFIMHNEYIFLDIFSTQIKSNLFI